MKNVTYFLTMILAVALMSTSCDPNDDPIVPDNEITTSDLLGDWDFVSLEIVGDRTYYVDIDDDMVDLDNDYNWGAISFIDVTPTEIGLLDHFGSSTPIVKEYVLEDNKIIYDYGLFVYVIQNVEIFDGTLLKLKLESGNGSELPINGIYTLEKR